MRVKLINYQCVNRSDFKPGSSPDLASYKILNFLVFTFYHWATGYKNSLVYQIINKENPMVMAENRTESTNPV